MAELSLTAIFGFVAFIISWGILVPAEARAFNLLAAAGAMVGRSLGRIAAKNVKRPRAVMALLLVALLVFFATLLSYLTLVQRGSAEVTDLVVLGGLLMIAFVSFAFLIPFTGATLGSRR